MSDYRKSIVLFCESLEELDRVTVHIAERMHYQGLIELDLDTQLCEIKQRKVEEELKSKLEDELMQEFLDENGMTEEQVEKKQEARKDNWDSFQRLEEFQDLQKGFMRLKKEIKNNQRIVKSISKQRRQVLYDHYKILEQRYLADNEKQQLVEEYKHKRPEEYERKCLT